MLAETMQLSGEWEKAVLVLIGLAVLLPIAKQMVEALRFFAGKKEEKETKAEQSAGCAKDHQCVLDNIKRMAETSEESRKSMAVLIATQQQQALTLQQVSTTLQTLTSLYQEMQKQHSADMSRIHSRIDEAMRP